MVMGMNEPMNKADKAVIRHYIMYSFIDSWYLRTIYVLRQDIVQLYFIHACRIQELLVWVLSTANLLNATRSDFFSLSPVPCKARLGDGHIPLQPFSKSYGQLKWQIIWSIEGDNKKLGQFDLDIWMVVLNIFDVHPDPWGNVQFDQHIFQMGWFNHQL